MTAGDSKAALTITPQPALAPSPQPRPAPTARALPPGLVAQVGQNWTPIVGQNWMPIDTTCEFQGAEVDLAVSAFGAKAEEAPRRQQGCFHRASTLPLPDGGAPRYSLCWLASSGAGAQSLRGGRGARAPRESFRAATGKPSA